MLQLIFIIFVFLLNPVQASELDTTTCDYVRYVNVQAPCFSGGDFGECGAEGNWTIITI